MSGQDLMTESMQHYPPDTNPSVRSENARFPEREPLFDTKGKIVKLDSFGVTIATKGGKMQLYLCCHKQTRFEAKKGTPLSRSHTLSLSDFKIGDTVQLRFEGRHFIVQRLRLLERPS